MWFHAVMCLITAAAATRQAAQESRNNAIAIPAQNESKMETKVD